MIEVGNGKDSMASTQPPKRHGDWIRLLRSGAEAALKDVAMLGGYQEMPDSPSSTAINSCTWTMGS